MAEDSAKAPVICAPVAVDREETAGIAWPAEPAGVPGLPPERASHRCHFCGRAVSQSSQKEMDDMKKKVGVLVPTRRRRPPQEGWSWIDRRFLREYAPRLERDSILLYFFLAAVSNKDGISFWGDWTIAAQLRMTEGTVAKAREELVQHDLIAYASAAYQVLSIPSPPQCRRGDSQPTLLGDIFRELAERRPGASPPREGKKREER